jgi:hypothetical protein
MQLRLDGVTIGLELFEPVVAHQVRQFAVGEAAIDEAIHQVAVQADRHGRHAGHFFGPACEI